MSPRQPQSDNTPSPVANKGVNKNTSVDANTPPVKAPTAPRKAVTSTTKPATIKKGKGA